MLKNRRSVLDEILDVQRGWARQAVKMVDSKGYVDRLDSNLFQPLSKTIRESLLSGAGSELEGKGGAAPKFNALHSSSALAVNMFAYWEARDSRPLTEALGIEPASGPPEFEKTFKTGLSGTPPHLDVVLPQGDDRIFAIESKYTEWLSPKSSLKPVFREAYLSDEANLWAGVGLPGCQRLAQDMQDQKTFFMHLDAAQLLKHALGLAKQKGAIFSLGYLYYDWACEEGEVHRREIETFQRRVGEEIPFVPMPYQTLFRRLIEACGSDHIEYQTYLHERYFYNVDFA